MVDGKLPSVAARLAVIVEFAECLRCLGPFNFIYTDGDTLFVHAHRRAQSDGEVRPPGLHLLVRKRDERAVDLSESGIMMSLLAQELTLVASVPLTDESWQPLAEGEVIALREGIVHARQARPSASADSADCGDKGSAQLSSATRRTAKN